MLTLYLCGGRLKFLFANPEPDTDNSLITVLHMGCREREGGREGLHGLQREAEGEGGG